jgi:hypothetical protein
MAGFADSQVVKVMEMPAENVHSFAIRRSTSARPAMKRLEDFDLLA